MGNSVVIGLQYGDEGKGRVSGLLINDYDWSIRYNGANNAGHTVYDTTGNKHKLHHLPAGAIFGKKVALDTGMAVNLEDLWKECEKLNWNFPLYISNNVHVIFPNHIAKDGDGSGIGSTKRGIAYVYGDRALRKGTRIEDINIHLIPDNVILYSGLPPIENNERALLEGAQGIMLDVDYGNYPYVTSSSILPSIAHNITRKIGVMKAYTSRVGEGPPYYPDNEKIREAGDEYGTTTGRPRKCTWNDIDQLKYAFSIVQPDEVVVTKLDVLGNLNGPICVYENGQERCVGNLDSYKNFLLECFPQIKWFSESPQGNMIRVI